MSVLKNKLSPETLKELHRKGMQWGPIKSSDGRTMKKSAYIRDRFVQQRRSQSRPACRPKLQLRSIRQRLPADDEWKVRHLRSKGFKEFNIVKSLVDNKGFLSAALQQLLRGSRLSGEDAAKIEKYQDFFRSRVNMFDVELAENAKQTMLEDVIVAMTEKLIPDKGRVVRVGDKNTHVHVLLEGRAVALKKYQPRGGLVRDFILREFLIGDTFSEEAKSEIEVVAVGQTTVGRIPIDLCQKYIPSHDWEYIISHNMEGITSKLKSLEKRHKLDLSSIMPVFKKVSKTEASPHVHKTHNRGSRSASIGSQQRGHLWMKRGVSASMTVRDALGD